MNPATQPTPDTIVGIDTINTQLGILEALSNNLSVWLTWTGILFAAVFAIIFGLLGLIAYLVFDSKQAQKEAKMGVKKIQEASSQAVKMRDETTQAFEEAKDIVKDLKKMKSGGKVKLSKEQEKKLLARIKKVEKSIEKLKWPMLSASGDVPTFAKLDHYAAVGTPSVGASDLKPSMESAQGTTWDEFRESLKDLRGSISEASEEKDK